ncbi:hypothetical protein [Trichodesmium erythraeum]|nr:hypothetical protein [Trichodesmium sp. St11_bin5]MDT9338713.1 hypothetical protein [Trichodesmium erythraeum 21-75]
MIVAQNCHDTKTVLDYNSCLKLKLQELPDNYLWMDDAKTGMYP